MPKKLWLGLALLSGLFLYQFFQFNVLQDDAFISFRYIRNFLDGHGLVFNLGERVEGYTNFLWIILLSLLTKLGLPLIETSRVLGIAAGIATIVLSAYATHKLYPKRNWLWILSVPLLLAANGAFAYWAGSGLETGLFTLLATAAAITYLTNTPLALLLVTLATLTRPEGALLAFLFGVAGIILKQKSWKATLTYWGALALLMLPYTVFKWLYFGSLLPNPFHAKTGFSAEYWKSGLEYTALFFKHYGLYGIFFILPIIFWKKLSSFSRFTLFVFGGFALYLIAIGGDVLKGHRFFVPVLLFCCLPLADSLYQIFDRRPHKKIVFTGALALAAFYSILVPQSHIGSEAALKRDSNVKMTALARLLAQDSTVQCLATTAIGVLSYYIPHGRVIDMLGLTDAVVAKNPQQIEGLVSTWKERNFNAGYVLSRKPDVIVFTTGFKPSGLAERALFLYPDFRQNYRLEFLCGGGMFDMYYRRFQNKPVKAVFDQSPRFVNNFNRAVNLHREKKHHESVALLRECLSDGVSDCATLYTLLGSYYYSAGYPESSEVYLKKGMELDGGGSVSRYYYATLLYAQKRYSEATAQDLILMRTVPNYLELLSATRGRR